MLLEPIEDDYSPVVDTFESGAQSRRLPSSKTNTRPTIGSNAATMIRPTESTRQPTSSSGSARRPRRRRTARARAERNGHGHRRRPIDQAVRRHRHRTAGTGRSRTGHDVAPIVELASKNSFRVRVIGFRGADAVEERFPDAVEVSSTSPSSLRDAHEFDERTYVVVMTHNSTTGSPSTNCSGRPYRTSA